MSDKPDWEKAPEWAQFLAMDSSGQWFWFVNEPRLGDHHWMPSQVDESQDYENAFEEVEGEFSSDFAWTSTLSSRP